MFGRPTIMSARKSTILRREPERARRYEQRRKNSYLDAENADVWLTFVSDDSKATHIPAHKYLLSMVSDVFEAKFTMNGKKWIK